MNRYTPAQKRAADKYRNEKIERIEITVPNGRKATYQEAAAAAGKSLNRFIVDCIETAISPAESSQDGH